MVIPIEESLIYVRPLYLRAQAGRIPELTRVIVAYQNRIVMDRTLDAAIAQLFGTERAARGRRRSLAADHRPTGAPPAAGPPTSTARSSLSDRSAPDLSSAPWPPSAPATGRRTARRFGASARFWGADEALNECRVQGAGAECGAECRVRGAGCGAECGVLSAGCRVPGARCLVPAAGRVLGCRRTAIRTRHSALRTRHPALGTLHRTRHPAPGTQHRTLHAAPCTLHPAPPWRSALGRPAPTPSSTSAAGEATREAPTGAPGEPARR